MDAADDLTRAVGTEPPPGLRALDPAAQVRLAALVDTAARNRTRAMNHAIEDSLRHLPRLLRGPVRRSLGL